MWHPRATGEAAYPIELTLEKMADSADAEFGGDTGWVNLTLLNGWSSVPGMTAQYRVKGGFVMVHGRVTGGSGTVATLPVDARPSAQFNDPVREGGGTGFTIVIVTTGGDINPVSTAVAPNLDLLFMAG